MLCHRVVIVALLAVSFAVTTIAPADLKPADSRKTAPDFSLEDSSGALIKLSGYKGRVVLLDFWATWCTGCKVEIPWYMEFQKRYARRGLTSIGVAMDEQGWRVVNPYLEQHPINYPVVVGDADVPTLFQVNSLPVTLL